MLDLLPTDSWGIFPDNGIRVIAGPCSAESEHQVLDTAASLSGQGIVVLRAGLWKPRTYPGCFEGVGAEGIPWLVKARESYGLKICTEVATAAHVRACLDAGFDMLWIGARTTANPFMMQEIADALSGADIPVLVKNPVSQDIGLWLGALERLNAGGIRKLGVIHRGFSSVEEKKYRNAPEWQLAIEMRTLYPKMLFLCDPSHIAGDALYVREISQRAMDLGLDGLMVESHDNPSQALSDASQQLTPTQLGEMLRALKIRDTDSQDLGYRTDMEQLRARIDEIDRTIVSALASRMEVSRLIGQSKKNNNIAILQTSRWDEVLANVASLADGLGLDPAFATAVFNVIHDASVQEQNTIISSDDTAQQ